MVDTPFGPSGIDTTSHQGISRYTLAQLADYLTQHNGNIAATARELDISRRSLKDKIDKTPELKELMADIIEDIVDTAQSNVFTSVRNGDLGESRFILTTLGKDRGFVARTETNKDPIQVNVRTFSDSSPNSIPSTDDSPSMLQATPETEDGAG